MADVEIVKDGAGRRDPAQPAGQAQRRHQRDVHGRRRRPPDARGGHGAVGGVLSGEGADFCAGNDLADFVSDAGPTGAAHLLELLPKLTKPLVAAAQGKSIGIGATILLHCDLVYVASDLDLRFVFVDIGVVPEAGSTMLLAPSGRPGPDRRGDAAGHAARRPDRGRVGDRQRVDRSDRSCGRPPWPRPRRWRPSRNRPSGPPRRSFVANPTSSRPGSTPRSRSSPSCWPAPSSPPAADRFLKRGLHRPGHAAHRQRGGGPAPGWPSWLGPAAVRRNA